MDYENEMDDTYEYLDGDWLWYDPDDFEIWWVEHQLEEELRLQDLIDRYGGS